MRQLQSYRSSWTRLSQTRQKSGGHLILMRLGQSRLRFLQLPFVMGRAGYTIVELMVIIVIVTIMAATVGTFFVKLLTIQENEREEAYISEKLADICAAYADALSVGSSISTCFTPSNQEFVVKYRQETGGVSLETGIVTRVAYLTSTLNPTNRNADLDAYGVETEALTKKLSRTMSGDAHLLPLQGEVVSCTIMPCNAVKTLDTDSRMRDFHATEVRSYYTAETALGYLQLAAQYRVKNDKGEIETKTARVERVVRLWNRE